MNRTMSVASDMAMCTNNTNRNQIGFPKTKLVILKNQIGF